MYNGSYAKVSKYSLEAQKKMQHRHKGKSCGYYMRIIFFFSSLIQSLIIASLVLFLVYGKTQDSASSDRIKDLEESFGRLSMENVDLRNKTTHLNKRLNLTLTEKRRNDLELLHLRALANVSYLTVIDLTTKLNQCMGRGLARSPSNDGQCICPRPAYNTDYATQVSHLEAMNQYLKSNLTQTIAITTAEKEQIAKERDAINLEAIDLRKDKHKLEWTIESYKTRCKQDFANSLSGISNVTRAFLEKIESLFPEHIPFQITCQKQGEHLEQIRSNCTRLSKEVEDKFQQYLDRVGSQVSQIQGQISEVKASNNDLKATNRWCTQNRTGLIQEHRKERENAQLRHDKEKEKLIFEKRRLIGEKETLNSNVAVKDTEISHLKEKMRQLNTSCSPKIGTGQFPTVNRYNPSRLSTGSLPGAAGLNKPPTNGISSNVVFASGSTGTDTAKTPGTSNTRPLFGMGSAGATRLNVPAIGSTALENLGMGGVGSTGLNGAGSLGNRSTKVLGSVFTSTGGGTAGGASYGGLGVGRTAGQGGTVGTSQLLKELQRYANPSSTEKKNDAPKVLG